MELVNIQWSRLSDSETMTPWEVIEAALHHKKRSPLWLANQLEDTSIQVVSNWKKRGVPARRYREIATALGITVDQLEGLEPLPWAKEFAWPFSSQLQEQIERFDADQLAELEQVIWSHLRARDEQTQPDSGLTRTTNPVTVQPVVRTGHQKLKRTS